MTYDIFLFLDDNLILCKIINNIKTSNVFCLILKQRQLYIEEIGDKKMTGN